MLFYDKLGSTSGITVAGLTLTAGSSYSQFSSPTSVYVDLNGSIYVADSLNYRVQKWIPGQPLGFTVAGGRGNGATLDKIGRVYAIFVDDQGNIYVSENSNHRVTLWYSFNMTAGQVVRLFCFPLLSFSIFTGCRCWHLWKYISSFEYSMGSSCGSKWYRICCRQRQ